MSFNWVKDFILFINESSLTNNDSMYKLVGSPFTDLKELIIVKKKIILIKIGIMKLALNSIFY